MSIMDVMNLTPDLYIDVAVDWHNLNAGAVPSFSVPIDAAVEAITGTGAEAQLSTDLNGLLAYDAHQREGGLNFIGNEFGTESIDRSFNTLSNI